VTEGPVETPAGPTEVVSEPNVGGAPVESPSGGDNPAWSSILDVLPSSLHETVKPGLKEWDRGVNSKFEEYNEQLKPWKPFIDEKVDPQTLAQARQLYDALNADPEAFYKQMGEYYQYTQAAPVGAPVVPVPVVDPTGGIDFGDPAINAAWAEQQNKLAQQEQLLVTMAQAFMGERQQAEQAQTEAQQNQLLETAMADAKAKHGEFNDQIVLTLLSNHGDIDRAVTEYKAMVDSELAARNRPPGPVVLSGAGGAMPTPEPVDLKGMNSKQTKDLVVEMLRASATT
jgi:hypothetical protein